MQALQHLMGLLPAYMNVYTLCRGLNSPQLYPCQVRQRIGWWYQQSSQNGQKFLLHERSLLHKIYQAFEAWCRIYMHDATSLAATGSFCFRLDNRPESVVTLPIVNTEGQYLLTRSCVSLYFSSAHNLRTLCWIFYIIRLIHLPWDRTLHDLARSMRILSKDQLHFPRRFIWQDASRFKCLCTA